LLLAIAGPWVFDRLNVPSEYPCTSGVRLEGDFCGIPLPGIRIFFWGIIGLPSSIARIISGESALAQGSRDILVSLLLLLLFLPVVSQLRLAVKGDGRRRFTVAALVPAIIVMLLVAITGITPLHQAAWGIWLYLGLVALALVLETLVLRRERVLAPDVS